MEWEANAEGRAVADDLLVPLALNDFQINRPTRSTVEPSQVGTATRHKEAERVG
jgi:hypothetical protein